MKRVIYTKLKESQVLWFLNGVLALGLAGFYSIMLVLLRTPGISPFISAFIQSDDVFTVSLVVHVNLSVLFWLVSGSAFIMSHKLTNSFETINRFNAYLALFSTILVAASPLLSDGEAYKNNYVPMFNNLYFVIGLSLFTSSILISTIISVFHSIFYSKKLGFFIKIKSFTLSIIIWVALINFYLAYRGIQGLLFEYPMEPYFYYELLFWGGGHVLQFLFTQILIIFWSRILIKDLRDHINWHFTGLMLILNCVLVLPTLGFYHHGPLDNGFYTQLFTDHMKYCGGVVSGIMFAYFTFILIKYKQKIHFNSIWITGYITSNILFIFGGMIGLAIMGTNVTIPAHYHGSIVGISVAQMAAFYYSLNKWKSKSYVRLSAIQLMVITIGQIMHISGLAWSGGYGALRKTPGVELTPNAKMGMALMGTGGLIAIIGGLIFVYICGRSLYQLNTKATK